MNLNKAILFGEELLGQHGIADPRWNAERLLLLATKQNRAGAYANLDRELSDDEWLQYESLLKKRSEQYPLAYLEGTQEFFGRTFYVDPSVLIPRPETEEIVRAALDLPFTVSPMILDLGAGSGCIGVTLSREMANCKVIALEYSSDALQVLRRNAQEDAQIVRGNLYVLPFCSGCFDLIVSNPPYVEQPAYGELPAETKWEPSLALVTDSLEKIYETLLLQTFRILKPGGYVVFEIGFGQEERVKEIISRHSGFGLLEIRKDYRALPRTFILQKKHS